MKIFIVAPSVFMSPIVFPNRIFAPRAYMTSLADGLVDKGHDVTFFSAPGIKTKAKVIPGSSELLEQNLIRDKFISLGMTEDNKLESFIELKHIYSLNLISTAYELANKEKADIIQTDNHLVHYYVSLANSTTLFTQHDPLPKKDTLDYWFLSKYKNHKYISISHAQRAGSLSLDFVDNIYHGISLEDYKFYPQDNGYLAHMGRILVQKGLNFAIEASKKSNSSLKIATDTTYMNTEYFDNEISPHLNDSDIAISGFMKEQDDKNEFIGKAKALIMPYKWNEPFGYAMIEAMAAGCPVIAYNRGSVSEVVKDGVSGFIVNDDKQNGNTIIKNKGVDGLVEAINRISEIDRVRCRQHVEEKFSVNKMVDNYESLYKKFI